MKKITSRENPRFKELRDIAESGGKQKHGGLTLIDGPHLVEAYRQTHGIPKTLVFSESGLERPDIQNLVGINGEIETLMLTESMFRDLSGTVTPVGVLAVIAIPPAPTGSVPGSCILLDGIQDSGNVGTILRTAAAAGIADAILGPGCASPWSPKVLRAGQGAHFRLRIRQHKSLHTFIRQYQGKSLATVVHGGTSIFATQLRGHLAWIFGSEGQGVSAELMTAATERVMIPMQAGSESLNVTAAAAVCLFESVRQNSV